MPLGIRIFLVYFLFVGLSSYFVLSTVMDEIKPGVRQSTEETLVDTAHLLAEILREPLKDGTLSSGTLPELLTAYGRRQPHANIWGIQKSGVSHRIYVTDDKGIVILDSSGTALGQDYSRWNDVLRTLRGEYGARSTPEIAGDDASTVMYVAAPIVDDGKIIGAVSVGKPNSSLQPYIDRSQRRLGWLGGGLIALGLVIGALLSWWLSGALRNLTRYARAVSAGQRAALPHYAGGELEQLSTAIEHMRTQLEDKAYVERYVQTLTHEIKSPLASIRGAVELLQGDMDPAQRAHFVANIGNESVRLQHLVERLLHLALVEQRRGLEERVAIPLHTLVDELTTNQAARIHAAGLLVQNNIAADTTALGEPFLLRQALANLLDNAIDFTPSGGTLRIDAERRGDNIDIRVFNQGAPIPDFALPRLTERFYSLPRPASGRKSTGLGLNFVQEVADLHGGLLQVRNVVDGVEATLTLPAAT